MTTPHPRTPSGLSAGSGSGTGGREGPRRRVGSGIGLRARMRASRRGRRVAATPHAMALRVRAGDHVWVDPDEPAADGRFVAVRDGSLTARHGFEEDLDPSPIID